MAYAQDAALIKSAQKSAGALKVAATWSTGKRLSVRDDFLYEMHLLFSLLRYLKANYAIEYVPGSGANPHDFPRAPASKAGWPRFNARDKGHRGALRFQICAGTEIADKTGGTRAPDISVQRPLAKDNPSHSDAVQVFDAKYRPDSSKRITRSDYATFENCVRALGLASRRRRIRVKWGTHSDFQRNCLVTNGEFSTETVKELRARNVTEIVHFYPGKTRKNRP